MEQDKQLQTLSAETLASSIVLASLLSKLARIPTLRSAVVGCFNQSEGMAEDVASMFDPASSPDHLAKVVRAVQEMRMMVLGDVKTPTHLV
jgi:hypothetical protein